MTAMERIKIIETDQYVEVPAPVDANGVRLLRDQGTGLLRAEVRETDARERELICNKRYAATWVGWHRGQTPAYGDTPETAVRALAAGRLAGAESEVTS